MDNLISRQAVLDKAYELDLIDTGNDIRVWVVDVDEVKKLPAAEPRKGKWISETGQYYQVLRCDQCGHVTVEQVRNYCPNCGARMEERDEHTD